MSSKLYLVENTTSHLLIGLVGGLHTVSCSGALYLGFCKSEPNAVSHSHRTVVRKLPFFFKSIARSQSVFRLIRPLFPI